jgi:hypothetical protein
MKVEILNESSLSVVQIIGRMDATTVSIFDDKAKEIYCEK